MYISYRSVYASDSCSAIGTTRKSTIVAHPTSLELSSLYFTEFFISTASFNITDLNTPVPDSIFYRQLRCHADAARFSAVGALTEATILRELESSKSAYDCNRSGPYEPVLVVASEVLRSLDPLWASCSADIRGQYDPPHALEAAAVAAQPTPIPPHWSPTQLASPAASPQSLQPTKTFDPAGHSKPPKASPSAADPAVSSQDPSGGFRIGGTGSDSLALKLIPEDPQTTQEVAEDKFHVALSSTAQAIDPGDPGGNGIDAAVNSVLGPKATLLPAVPNKADSAALSQALSNAGEPMSGGTGINLLALGSLLRDSTALLNPTAEPGRIKFFSLLHSIGHGNGGENGVGAAILSGLALQATTTPAKPKIADPTLLSQNPFSSTVTGLDASSSEILGLGDIGANPSASEKTPEGSPKSTNSAMGKSSVKFFDISQTTDPNSSTRKDFGATITLGVGVKATTLPAESMSAAMPEAQGANDHAGTGEINNTPISVGTGGLFIDGSSIPTPSVAPAVTPPVALITLGSSILTAIRDNGHTVVAGQTLSAGDSAVIISGGTISADPSGVVVDGSVHSFSIPVANTTDIPDRLDISAPFTVADKSYTAYKQSGRNHTAVVFSDDRFSTSLSVGGPAETVNGQIVSLEPSGIVVGSSTIPFSTVPATSE